MVTINVESFPQQCFEQVGVCFLEAPPLPGFMKIDGPYFRNVEGKGFEAITIYEYDAIQQKDAADFIRKRTRTFECVEGFNCSSDSWLEPREAFEMRRTR